MEASAELNENGDISSPSVAGEGRGSTRRGSADAADPPTPPPCSNPRTADRTAASLSVAERDYLEHMEGMPELRAKMRLRPLRVRCQKFIPSSADDEDHQPGNNAVMRGTPSLPLPPNAKVVHLVRHGQGFHNLMADLYHDMGRTWTQFVASPNNPYTRVELTDSPLTEVGRRQAVALQPHVLRLGEMGARPQLVTSSPQTRALQTALLAFEPLLVEGCVGDAHDEGHCRVPFVAHEMLREETGVHVCDRRRPASRLVRDFGAHFDFGLLPEQDGLFQETRRESKEEVGDRAYHFLEWLEARSERHVAVSSHSAWLLTLLNGVCDCDDDPPGVTSWFQTGEMRSVVMHFARTSP
jgi:broad specificity phosphatase PhoE